MWIFVLHEKNGAAGKAAGDAPPPPAYLYYFCSGRNGRRFGGEPICDGPMLPAARLDAAVWDDVRAVLLDPARVEREYTRRLVELELGRKPATPTGADRRPEATDLAIADDV